LRLKHDIQSLTLVPSSGGAFEVTMNGERVHSKLATGEFPNPEAILKLARARR
jgi:selenoprotein W-related protein